MDISAPFAPLSATLSTVLGPFLSLDDLRDGQMHLAALFVAPNGIVVSPVVIDGFEVAPEILADFDHVTLWRCRFRRPATQPSTYRWEGQIFGLAGCPEGAMRIAYVSCNGEEHGDLSRDGAERNAMWARLVDDHDAAPFSLLLHGGDQVYADEVTLGHELSEDWPDSLPRDPSRADLDSLRHHLREGFLERYLSILAGPEYAAIAARVPSLMQWDDHDICDGWGSLRRSRTYSPVGQLLFQVAREVALLFQHGCNDDDLPRRFADKKALHLGWQIDAPGLRLLAPDLRSERSRREVMGDGGWQMMQDAAGTPSGGRTLIMSSAPLLGPRLSVLEALMVAIPSMQKYEDDLRDQWQSRAHRGSWQRMLRLMQQIAEVEDQEVTVLSGEIHLATRAEMALSDDKTLHQLVASGISHRAPPGAWARVLDALARLGDSPLPGHPIRIRHIPGQPRRYVNQRNYLVLENDAGAWAATWALEDSGRSPELPI
ncbi:alkaline phosphatase family protein [Phaeobacter sp. CNT1-3]|nr:alkaline phosphatase family protein [Phaeobacter sp. CNT1-3]